MNLIPSRTICIRSTCLLCYVLLAFFALNRAVADERPNIVFLLADDQCTYSMGCYGTPGAKTPNLDRLARDGMIFDRHYDTTAICMASRVNIMTGLYEYRAGCNFDSGNLLESHWQASYPILLRKAGYRTAFAGKFGFTVAPMPNQKGRLPEDDFDSWGGGPGQTSYVTAKNSSMKKYASEYPHSTLSYAAFSEDFIEESAGSDHPFCLSISFKAPHHPVQPDPQFDDVYKGAKFVKPSNYGRENGKHFSKQSQQGRQYERFYSWHYADKYDETMALYYQQIYAIDVAVGRIRESLSKHGLAENTVIIYTSDNGFFCGAHGYGSKVLPYEESSRVPLIVHDPRHESSGKRLRCSALTGNVDMAATILELAEIKDGPEMDGRSVLELLDSPDSKLHDWLPLINVWGPNKVHSFGVVSDKGKLIYWPFGGEDFVATEEAYDVVNDELELHNLIGDPASKRTVDELRKVYSIALEDWKKNCVSYHGYSRFGVIFDPKLGWDQKSPLYTKSKKK